MKSLSLSCDSTSATVLEAPPGQKIKAQFVAKFPERKRPAAPVGHQPDLGHAAIVQ
jgi:hypothetical protein